MVASKGSAFEREVCRELSLWWTRGERDDVFWRTAQSGGRATQRAKIGKETAGGYGDVAAVDSIGQPLLRVFACEIKRGDSHGSPFEWFDSDSPAVPKPWAVALFQAVANARLAKAFTWLLVHRRDRHRTMVCVGGEVKASPLWKGLDSCTHIAEVRHKVDDGLDPLIYFYLPWEEFAKAVDPVVVASYATQLCPARTER